MTNRFLYIYWALLYVICAVLGFIQLPIWVEIGCSLLFFLPPAVLLRRYRKADDYRGIRKICILAGVWLAVTVIMLIVNILSAALSAQAGTVLYYMLIVLTSPMVAGQYWVVSLFLWACVLMAGLQLRKNRK